MCVCVWVSAPLYWLLNSVSRSVACFDSIHICRIPRNYRVLPPQQTHSHASQSQRTFAVMVAAKRFQPVRRAPDFPRTACSIIQQQPTTHTASVNIKGERRTAGFRNLCGDDDLPRNTYPAYRAQPHIVFSSTHQYMINYSILRAHIDVSGQSG